jgi:hypothetical protein
MENNTLESLNQKLSVIASLIMASSADLKSLEENLKRVEGFSFGAKDISEKFESFVGKSQAEILALLKEEKLSAPVANLLNTNLINSLKFVKESAVEADRMLYVRRGEILGIRSRFQALISLEEQLKEQIKLLEAPNDELNQEISEDSTEKVDFPPVEDDSQSRTKEEEKSEDVAAVRPDKNSKTKIGRAALDIASRRKRSKEKAEGDTQLTSDGVSKKRGKKPKA